MPYVEGFGTWPFGEEWLFEAVASSYLPLLERCQRWAEAGDQDVLTIGVTPVLSDQLVVPDVGRRLLRFIRETRADCHRRDTEGLERAGQPRAAAALVQSARDYERAAEQLESLDGDILGTLRRLRDRGTIELWASAATHAVLPLIATEAGMRFQLTTGIEAHRHRFGHWSGGFWLPECAFKAGIDEQLSCAGVRVFCVDQTAGGDFLDQLEPVAAAGAVALPIDWHTISLVWDESRGYPADPLYRDYHAPSTNGLRPYANSGEPYSLEAAATRAEQHASDFVDRVVQRLDGYRADRGRPGLVVFALDTELLGHWWYEGPLWLSAVVDEAQRVGLALTTVPKALERHEARKRTIRDSSWGWDKNLGTWDSPQVAELVWPARRAELALTGALRAGVNGSVSAAERAARELLALQSSDWAFMASRRTAADYPQRRVCEHAAAFERALASLRGGMADCRDMLEAEDTDPRLRGLAPELRLASLLEPPSSWGRASVAGAAR